MTFFLVAIIFISALSYPVQERVILLSMMADCSDECLGLVRVFDSESFDSGSMAFEISSFCNKLDYLFNQGNCLDHGYVKEMISYLRRQRGFMDSRGQPKTLGGPGRVTVAMLQNCIERLQLFTLLATDTIRSEFPDYVLLMCLSAFNLENYRHSNPEERLSRLAQVFDIDARSLCDQFFDIRPMALHEYSKGCSNEEAWLRTLQRLDTKQASVKRAHPSSDLRKVIIRFLV